MHNPAEVARLIAEAREDDERMTRGPWSVPSGTRLLGAVNATIDGMDRQVASAAGQALQFDDTADVGRQLGINAAAIARTRNNLRAMADQLEAAQAEIARWKGFEQQEERYANDLTAERDRLHAELEAARREVERLAAYEREYGDAALLLNSLRVPLKADGKHLTMIERIDAYRAARDKGGDRG